MCRNILIEALTGSQDTQQNMEALQESQKELEDAQKALLESQKELEDAQKALLESQRELEDAQKALLESQRDLEALQGQMKDLQGVHDELLALRVSHAKLEGQVKDLQGVSDELLATQGISCKTRGTGRGAQGREGAHGGSAPGDHIKDPSGPDAHRWTAYTVLVGSILGTGIMREPAGESEEEEPRFHIWSPFLHRKTETQRNAAVVFLSVDRSLLPIFTPVRIWPSPCL